MKRIMLAGCLLALAGCNTMSGLGRDLQQAGAVISGTATGVQNASEPGRTSPPPPEQASPQTSPAANCQPDSNGLTPVGCPAQ